MSVVVTTPATEWPVTLAEVKDQCKVDGTAHDARLNSLISAATGHVEAYCGRSFSAQTLTLYLDEFEDEITLPRGPVSAVSSVKYYDSADALQTLSGTVYESDLRSDPATVSLASGQAWPTPDARKNAIEIAYTAGSAGCPAPVKQAILIWIQAAFDGNPTPAAFEHLLTNQRSYGA